jgi:hypothetical protein
MNTKIDRRVFLAALSCFSLIAPALADDKGAKSDDGELWITIGGGQQDKAKYRIVVYQVFEERSGRRLVLVNDLDKKPIEINADDPGASVKPKDDDGNPTGRVTQTGNDAEANRVRIKLPPGNYQVRVFDRTTNHAYPAYETSPFVVRPGSQDKATKVKVDVSSGISVVKPQDRMPEAKGANGGNEPMPGRDKGDISND